MLHQLSRRIAGVRARLDEPLRVAIAGRVKAGKSTLLNALVGERLAPTDAGECTRLVTWYRQGTGYAVRAVLHSGERQDLEFERSDAEISVDLGPLVAAEIDWLEIEWPSRRLQRMTLVDTPGLAAIDRAAAERTRVFLGLEAEGHGEADAVVYLMRHLHEGDAEFLESFMDRSLSRPSPINAVGVLSRADEIGAGRLDALDSAEVIASRYRSDDRVRALCATVVPVAGLLAETGTTLREDEASQLRELAALDDDERTYLLTSVDRFCDPTASPLTVELRRELLKRFGIFGVRFCLRELREGRSESAADLSRAMMRASGVEQLLELVDGHFGRRAEVLKARSALVSLGALGRELTDTDPDRAAALTAAVERIESEVDELVELRLVQLVMSGAVSLPDAERDEIDRLTRDDEPAVRMGFEPGTDADALRSAALRHLEGWRERAAHPLADRATSEAYEIVARAYERIYAELVSDDG